MTLDSNWAWGAYRRGDGTPTDRSGGHYRMSFATLAIKKELVHLGYTGISTSTAKFGRGCDKAVRKFQRDKRLIVDGLAGPATCEALFRPRISELEATHGIEDEWMRRHLTWESALDPGAEYINEDAHHTRDRGLTQSNTEVDDDKLTDAEAFDPETALTVRAKDLEDWRKKFGPQKITILTPALDPTVPKEFDEQAIAVSAMRTPVGATALAAEPASAVITPKRVQEGGTWEQAAAFYIARIDAVP